MTNNEEFGSRLKDAREKKKLTQTDLTDRLSYVQNNASVSAYEKGKQYPAMDTIEELCEILDVSADWLLFGKEYEPQPLQSNKERIFLFLSLMEELGLRIVPEYSFNGIETGDYIIDLSRTPKAGFRELFDAVYKYRNLLSEGNLSEEDYQMLVRAKVNVVSDKTNDFEPCDPPSFPDVETQVNMWLDDNEPGF